MTSTFNIIGDKLIENNPYPIPILSANKVNDAYREACDRYSFFTPQSFLAHPDLIAKGKMEGLELGKDFELRYEVFSGTDKKWYSTNEWGYSQFKTESRRILAVPLQSKDMTEKKEGINARANFAVMIYEEPAPMSREWKAINHSYQIADTGDYDGHLEITNGDISLITKDDADEEDYKPLLVELSKFKWTECESKSLRAEIEWENKMKAQLIEQSAPQPSAMRWLKAEDPPKHNEGVFVVTSFGAKEVCYYQDGGWHGDLRGDSDEPEQVVLWLDESPSTPDTKQLEGLLEWMRNKGMRPGSDFWHYEREYIGSFTDAQLVKEYIDYLKKEKK